MKFYLKHNRTPTSNFVGRKTSFEKAKDMLVERTSAPLIS